ncbi:hypothetical protein DXA05_09150 [Bacteroides sp. AM54-2NS]|nr:hypothetical protein DXA05_09150 [Bacteroides sp. AM54-2NS]
MSTASDFVANLQKLSFFCLETKERNKEKFKTDFFLLLTPFTTLKGRNSLRSNNLPFLTLRYGCSLNGEKVGRKTFRHVNLCRIKSTSMTNQEIR